MGYAIGGGCGAAIMVLAAFDERGVNPGWMAFGAFLLVLSIILAICD